MAVAARSRYRADQKLIVTNGVIATDGGNGGDQSGRPAPVVPAPWAQAATAAIWARQVSAVGVANPVSLH